MNRTAVLNEMARGFDMPASNYARFPNDLILFLPQLTGSDVKVLLYIIRHTWGYGDTVKRITTSEFLNGRFKKDGDQIDYGAGVSPPTLRASLQRLQELGLIEIIKDDTDAARKRRFYSVRTRPESGGSFLHPEGKKFAIGGQEICHRTKKDTIERNYIQTEEQKEGQATHPSLVVDMQRMEEISDIKHLLLDVVNKGRSKSRQYYFDGGKKETKLQDAAESLIDMKANMKRLNMLFLNDDSWWYTESFGKNGDTPHPGHVATLWERADEWYEREMVVWK